MPVLASDIDCGRILARYAEHLSDVSRVRYTSGGTVQTGLGERTSLFCDNVTFQLKEGSSITDGVHALRKIFGNTARLTRGDNGRGCVRVLYTPEGHNEVREADIQACRAAGITMLDIDYTMDCRRITTRALVIEHIGDVKIADRGVQAVGRNCVSWWSDHDHVPAGVNKVRIKVYNTFSRSLETAGVRVTFGSGLAELLEGSDCATTLMEFQDSGVTRVELTFYGPRLLSRSMYESAVVDVIVRTLSGCPTFECSLSQQWNSFRHMLTRVAAVHDVVSSTFAICQWWNSETGKMQGASRTIKRAEEVEKLLGNYSFPECPINLIRITATGEHVERYRRSLIGRPLTMCTGRKGGLYPSGGRHQLHDYGLGVGMVGSNVVARLGWPATYSYRSRAIAAVELDESVSDGADIDILAGALEELTIVNSHYDRAYECLEPGSSYTVVGCGKGKFRGTTYIYVKLSDDKRVRCGASLEALVRQHAGARFSFTVDRKEIKKGYADAICFISSASAP